MRRFIPDSTRLASIIGGLLVLSGVLGGAAPAAGDLIFVPQDYSTIGAAANAASAGDSVLVGPANSPDEYYWEEEIFIKPGVSIIGTMQDSPMVSIGFVTIMYSQIVFEPPAPDHPLPEAARLEWFTIVGDGVLIVTENPACEIRYNKIRPIDAGTLGILCLSGGLIERNKLKGYGTPPLGILGVEGTITVRYNIFQHFARGLWIDNLEAGSATLVEFRNNTVEWTDLLLEMREDSSIDIVNNLFLEQSGIPEPCPATTSIRYNDFAAGLDLHATCTLEEGNLVGVDPQFCDSPPHIDYFYLEPTSPLLNSGEAGSLIGAFHIGCGATSVAPAAAPRRPALLTVRPNPVVTGARFVIDGPTTAAPMRLEIYDPGGRQVDLLHIAGGGAWTWTPDRSLPAGVYLARLRGGGVTAQTKFILLR